ncbi:unnamed protein product [Somion occarium]|uniref:PRA1 family protein n=1 Tax=Somion occarium TaxID=3059160 RepID=A0ABP1CZ31_9APHY
MPGLIQRYHPGYEYAELMATKITRGNDEDESDLLLPSSTPSRARKLGFHDVIAEEAASWGEAICPPASDVRAMLLRFQLNPDLSQKSVFDHIYPLFIFTTLFAIAAVVLHPGSFAHDVISNPANHRKEFFIGFIVFITGLLAGLALLRLFIWGGAQLIGWIIRIESDKGTRGRLGAQGRIPDSRTLLGSIFQ